MLCIVPVTEIESLDSGTSRWYVLPERYPMTELQDVTVEEWELSGSCAHVVVVVFIFVLRLVEELE